MAGIVGLGEAVIDFIPVPSSGDGNLNYQACPGGSVANLCVAAARLGVPGKFIGAVGDDFFGEFLKSTLSGYGVDVTGVSSVKTCGTALTFVNVEGSERGYSFANRPGADKLLEYGHVDLDSIKGADVLHVSSNASAGPVTFETQRRVLEFAGGLGKAISYDVNYRENNHESLTSAEKILQLPLEYATIIKATEEELELVTGLSGADGAKSLLRPAGRAEVVLVTQGKRGADFYTTEDAGHSDVPDIGALDTTGAGDAFLGGFLAFVIKNGGFEGLNRDIARKAVDFANRAASCAVMKRGVMTSFPTLGEVERIFSPGR
ncbi:MAG: carbohydrate kinase [Synergistaceae bacterium]|jgi:fructokinase|nr:carbohydrate kinase [Synergistaceae bacterium]